MDLFRKFLHFNVSKADVLFSCLLLSSCARFVQKEKLKTSSLFSNLKLTQRKWQIGWRKHFVMINWNVWENFIVYFQPFHSFIALFWQTIGTEIRHKFSFVNSLEDSLTHSLTIHWYDLLFLENAKPDAILVSVKVLFSAYIEMLQLCFGNHNGRTSREERNVNVTVIEIEWMKCRTVNRISSQSQSHM